MSLIDQFFDSCKSCKNEESAVINAYVESGSTIALGPPTEMYCLTLVLYSFSVFWDTFVYHYTGIMPNFNDVYLDNYKAL
jgi:hypothetical protein